MHQKGEFHKVATILESEQQTIEQEINTIKTCLQALQTSHEKAHVDIKVMRQKITALLDTLERNSVQSLNTSYETLQKSSLQSHLSICFKAQVDLLQIKDAIKDIDD
ncbi:hypothetical protein DPMN_087698 [Dreissena polymorpha]|uniref:Uncharacterized protein n=1 Tax=Dreissena polymorpha TaxID=45954 RepID=A0A9D4KTN2_DREPO|nr:hypothetical protein DPMN_087698 [Dreissena polymorpha]